MTKGKAIHCIRPNCPNVVAKIIRADIGGICIVQVKCSACTCRQELKVYNGIVYKKRLD